MFRTLLELCLSDLEQEEDVFNDSLVCLQYAALVLELTFLFFDTSSHYFRIQPYMIALRDSTLTHSNTRSDT
jgi:hypothetical protein